MPGGLRDPALAVRTIQHSPTTARLDSIRLDTICKEVLMPRPNHAPFALYVLLLLFFVSAPQIIYAQATTTGNLSGTVTDASGALVPNATLTIRNPAVGASVTQHSNAQGGYSFADLQVGAYTLTVSAQGFANTVIQNVLIDTGRSININPTLKVGTASEEVSVTSNQQVLETTTNTLAATIRPDAVQDLPIAGRDASPLTQLAPGAQTPGDARYGTFNALPTGAINITVDGMNSNFQKFRTASSGNYSPAPARLGAIEEVSVSTGDLTADSGAEGSVAIRYQIKRGTNKWHGSAFWEYQSSALNANSFSNDASGTPKTKFHYNDEGGNIGGPIWRDKVFLFANYEQEITNGKTSGSAYVLTSDAQKGLITYTYQNPANKSDPNNGTIQTVNVLNVLGSQMNPATGQNFPSAVNPFIASQLALVNKYTANSLTVTPTALPYQNISKWVFPTTTYNIYPTERIDWQISPRMDFHVAYDLWWRKLPGSQVYALDPIYNNNFKSSYQTITAGFDWTITPHIVNQVNIGILNDQEHYSYDNSYDLYASLNHIDYSAPTFTNGGAALAETTPSAQTEPRNNPVRDVFDNVTWNKGKHTFTFGGDWRYASGHDLSISSPPVQSLGIDRTNGDPADAQFSSTCAATCTGNFPGLVTTGSSTPDYNNLENLYATLTGRLNGVSGSNNFDTASKQYKQAGALVELDSQTVGGLYAQDNWRITPHLAINAGFRWQMSGAIHTPTPQYTQPTIADLFGPSTAPFQPGTLNGVSNPLLHAQAYTYSSDLREPAPNVGFAWNPAKFGGKLVVRGGGAISYYDEGWEPWEEAAIFYNPGVKQTISLASNTPGANQPVGKYSAGSLSLGDTISPLLTPATYSPPYAESAFTFKSTFYGTDPNLKTPQVQNWNLGVQYKIGWDTVVEVNYVGNHVIHMWQNFNINEVNIFENGFLTEFQNAQANYAASGGKSFTGPNTPIMNNAFKGTSGATNSAFLNDVKTGQAGALASSLATTSAYLCNLVGASFSPCATLNYSNAGTEPINFFTPNPYSAGAATLLSDPGSSNYNGLQTQIKHPVGHGLTLQVNYAYSHAFSSRYADSDLASDNFTTLRNKSLNRAPAPTDLRNAFTAYAVYAIPFHGSNWGVREALSGWVVSPIFTWTTGRNFRLLGGTNTVNANGYAGTADSGVVLNGIDVHTLQKKGVGYYRQPGSTSNPVLLLNPALFNESNPSQATVAPASTAGQFGQFIYLTSPQFVNTNFAVTKNFPIWEKVKLNIQAEMINLFNHPNFAILQAGANAPAGTVNISTAPTTQGAVSTMGSGSTNGAARAIQFRTNISF